jgi:hypothetical protein
MEHVKLLNRIDTKYVIHEDQLQEYLLAIGDQYRLLVIDGEMVHPYETLYFDTPDFNLYYMHHSGILNRYKLRCRKYVNSGISYFEVKSKTNTSRTIKNRMKIDDIPEALNQPMNQYITEHTPGVYDYYIPVLRVFFDRITLVNKQANERLTFDMNLRYRRKGIEKKVLDMVIVEVKQEKHLVSPLREQMKMNHQSQDYMSKYCMGLTCLNKGLKKNHFKQKINTLNKLGYEIH